jgi:hypothetical protein
MKETWDERQVTGEKPPYRGPRCNAPCGWVNGYSTWTCTKPVAVKGRRCHLHKNAEPSK